MSQWSVLFQKEWKESIRNYKWIWIPIVFILLGVMQPVTSYFLPDILKNFGGLPEGIEFPLPTGPIVLAETLGQFSQIGFLVLALAFMGTVAGEKNSGTQIMVLVKPVSTSAYILAKWIHMSLLGLASYFIGFLLAVYYTFELIETVAISNVIKGAFVYSIGLLFVITLVLLFSSIFKSTAAVAFLSLGITIAFSLLSSLLPDIMKWSPGTLTNHSYRFFETGSGGDGFILSIIVTIGLIISMIFLSIFVFKKKEIASHTT
ncbi:ABC transporter permease [Evansella sp. AB-rgal1]|uniref:ABC transporter permease n=1 Tax=Evansella sp. AB-rgal1 TaxID=3242696 RepID=UPI00359F0D24